jgi:CRISPR-associated protein Cas1
MRVETPHSEPLTWPLEGPDARAEWQRCGDDRETLADTLLSSTARSGRGRTLVLGGQGGYLGVELGNLVAHAGRTHGSPAPQRETFPPASHHLSAVIWVTMPDHAAGTCTLPALEWLRREGVPLTCLDTQGRVLLTTEPDGCASIALRRKQYAAAGSDAAVRIVRDILRRKLEAQRETLRDHTSDGDALDVFASALAWLALPTPPDWMRSTRNLLALEARCARRYWDTLATTPLRFKAADRKRMPPHWATLGPRTSALAPNGNGRHALTPGQARLNVAYGLLAGQIRRALATVGFDLAAGFLHADKDGRDSLTWDLIETRRAEVDRLVLAWLTKTTLGRGDFARLADGSITLHPQTCRALAACCMLPQETLDGDAAWLRDAVLTDLEHAQRRVDTA